MVPPVQVSLASLTFDKSLYPRKRVTEYKVEQYAQAMKAGREFPPIKYAHVDGIAVIIDGVHRWKAQKRVGHTGILAEDLGVMTRAQAFEAAVKYNVEHGHALSQVERMMAYKRMIDDGAKIERVSEILAIPVKEAERWRPKHVRDGRTGERFPTVQNHNAAVARRVTSLVVALKKELNYRIDSTETIQHLRGLKNLINQRYDPDVVKTVRMLEDALEKLLASLTSEEEPLT